MGNIDELRNVRTVTKEKHVYHWSYKPSKQQERSRKLGTCLHSLGTKFYQPGVLQRVGLKYAFCASTRHNFYSAVGVYAHARKYKR